MNRTVTTAVALAVSLLATRAATADTRSWTAVKKIVGKSDTAVIGIDLARLRTTTAFKSGLQLMLDAEPEAKQVFDTVKAECGFDLTSAVSDLTVVMQGEDHPLIAFGLDGLDEAKVVSCVGIVAGKLADAPGVTLTGTKKGKITEYGVKGEAKKLYVAWLAKDVMAFTEDANDRKLLEQRIAGKGAKGDLAKFLGKTSTAAPFWFAVAQKTVEDGRTILGGYAKLELAGGMFAASGALVLGKPADATAFAAEGKEALANGQQEVASKLPELGKVLTTVTMVAKGAEVVISAAVADKDVGTIIPQLDKVL